MSKGNWHAFIKIKFTNYMGTSVSQCSQRNTNWKPVHLGYEKASIPENRVIKEIWRASENEPIMARDKYALVTRALVCLHELMSRYSFDPRL